MISITPNGIGLCVQHGLIALNLIEKLKFDNMNIDDLKNETPADAKPMLAVRACEGSCEIHKGEVISVIIEGHGWDGTKFNYCQGAIMEDERRGFVVRHDR